MVTVEGKPGVSDVKLRHCNMISCSSVPFRRIEVNVQAALVRLSPEMPDGGRTASRDVFDLAGAKLQTAIRQVSRTPDDSIVG